MIRLTGWYTRLSAIAALLLLVSVLAACGGDNATATPGPPTPANGGNTGVTPAAGGEIIVTLTEWSIAPKSITAAAGHQSFKVVNAGKFPHNLSIVVNGEKKTSPNVAPGSSAIFETDLAAGTYDTLCAIPTHKEHGMAGTLTVK